MNKENKETGDDQTYRLTDLNTKEVSLVDRAANKRKFLIIKRSEKMNPELTQKANGELTEVKTDPVIKMRSDWKESVATMAQQALDRIVKIVDTVKSAEVKDAEDLEFPQEIVAELGEIASLIQALPFKTQKAANTHEALLKEKQEALQACAAKVAGGELKGADLQAEISKLSDIAWQIREPALVASISKADGHWMSQLKGIFDELKKVLGEFKEAMPKKAAVSGVGIQPDTSVITTVDQVFEKPEDMAKLAKSIERLQESITDLNGLRDSVAKAQADLAQLKSGVGLPAGSSEAEVIITKAGNDTTWPRDLNKPNKD